MSYQRNDASRRRSSATRAPHKRNNRNRRGPSMINPSKFVNKAVAPGEQVAYVPTHTFGEFGLNAQTATTLAHLGFDKPTPIQDQCIPLALEGKDIIGLANTGTGKTAAFALPVIEKTRIDRGIVSTLVLAPTRELAQQIDADLRRFAAGQKVYSALVVGGANINQQIRQIKRGPHVIIGTPGRVKDLINRRVLRLSQVTTFVLDEADRMCDMGFVNDIRSIESELPKERQTLCFSATMTPNVQSIVEEFMIDPTTVAVAKNITNDHIEQSVIEARDKAHKIDLLEELLVTEQYDKVIIFGETKYGVQRLADRLTKNDMTAVAIHGNKSQSQREKALRIFKNGDVRIMVATDVAARGLDIPNVSHVINFDAPKQYDDYVHRIGRTGRAGNSGRALTFVENPRLSRQ